MKTAQSGLEGKDNDGEGSSRLLKRASFPEKGLSRGMYYTCSRMRRAGCDRGRPRCSLVWFAIFSLQIYKEASHYT